MANGDGDDPRGPGQDERERRLREELEAKERQLQRALANVAEALESEKLARARAQDVREAAQDRVADAEGAAADAEKAAEERVAAARKAMEDARNEADDRVTEAQNEATRAKEELEKDNAANTLLKAAHAAQSGLHDFVRDSLSDILGGVDAAAAEARCRQLEEGLDESGFVSPSSVRAPVGGSRESVVEFDVAVIVGNQQMSGEETDVGGDVRVKAKMSVLPLGLEAGLSARRETRSEDRSELSHHNRIRFSVPVVFASHGDPVE